MPIQSCENCGNTCTELEAGGCMYSPGKRRDWIPMRQVANHCPRCEELARNLTCEIESRKCAEAAIRCMNTRNAELMAERDEWKAKAEARGKALREVHRRGGWTYIGALKEAAKIVGVDAALLTD